MRFSKTILIALFLLVVSGGCYKNEPVPEAGFLIKATNNFNCLLYTSPSPRDS